MLGRLESIFCAIWSIFCKEGKDNEMEFSGSARGAVERDF